MTLQSPGPFFCMVPAEVDGTPTFEIKYTLHASSLVTVQHETYETSENNSEDTESNLVSLIGEISQAGVAAEIVEIGDSDDDDVVIVSTPGKDIAVPLPKKLKPFKIVKPFYTSKDSEIIVLDNDDIKEEDVKDDENYEHDYYKELFEHVEKECEEESDSDDNFNIHDLCSTDPLSSDLNVTIEPVSKTTIKNYSMVRDCCVLLPNIHPRRDSKRLRSRSPSPSPSSSAEDTDDPLYIPYGTPTRGKHSKRKTAYVPTETYRDVYYTKPLNKIDRKRSRITFCDRVIDFLDCHKSPKSAAKLCTGFWESLSLRTKRKYIPRSRHAICSYEEDVPRIRSFIESDE